MHIVARDHRMRTSNLFGREICVADRETLEEHLVSILSERPRTALFCNVHMLMLSLEDPDLAAAMDQSDIVFSDGVPIAWLQRRQGAGDAAVLRGYESVRIICGLAAASGEPIGLFGSTTAVLDRLSANLQCQYPGLNIDYEFSPGELPEDSEINPSWVEQINRANLSVLMIGLGCPKQEKWAALYGPHLNCSLLAVGAAFDWLAGTTTKPPDWMEKRGLAWLFRLVQNPSRMFNRYMIYNSKFIFHVSKFLLSKQAT